MPPAGPAVSDRERQPCRLGELRPDTGVKARVGRFPDARAGPEPSEQRYRDQQLEQREAMLCRPRVAPTAHSDESPVRSVVSINCSAGLAPQATVTGT
jgi:hypothetical protein